MQNGFCKLPVRSSKYYRDWGRVLNGVHHKKHHVKISQITKFEVLLLDCNHVEDFQKLGKLETLTGHSMGSTQ